MRIIFRSILIRLIPALFLVAVLSPLSAQNSGAAAIAPAGIFTDNMVLQREKKVPVWGTAQADRIVTVTFAGRTKRAKVDTEGNWKVVLDPLKASAEPHALVIDYVPSDHDSAKVTISNVLIGEVWLCSGQSNMALSVKNSLGGQGELNLPENPLIRLFLVNEKTSPFRHNKTPGGPWRLCNEEGLTTGGWSGFSAVGYYFAKKLSHDLNVPVGVIQAAYGGAGIEPFIPLEGLKENIALNFYYQRVIKANARYAEALQTDPEARHPLQGVGSANHLDVTTAYNAMIYPLAPFAVRGFLWYQGESNMGQTDYAKKQKALISSWRRAFGQNDLAFYYVQIPPYGYGGDTTLPRFWEQQYSCLDVPGTGLAVTADLGDLKDIHPKRKREVGERLELIALAKTYKKRVAYSGPVYKSLKVAKNEAILSFDFAAKGLTVPDGQELSWFTIAGEDREFHPAKAVIRGATVVVTSDDVEKPAAVRYAWTTKAAAADDTPAPNLYNEEGLPARPFRTDK
ncbi:MAG: sialate O-acetylesterase [Spirochaetales bacterium]|nr:sialate O-acetylesterase [Spirochaetales bacterium]